jgi:subtilase family serine protease
MHFLKEGVAVARTVARASTIVVCGISANHAFAAPQPSPMSLVAAARVLANSTDLGAANGASSVSGTVWLTGRKESALDDAVAAIYDSDASTYHQWMSADDVQSYGPAQDEMATAKASLSALGLKIDAVSEDGMLLKVSGSAQLMGAAFGTSIHQWQYGSRTFYRAATAPTYTGTHAELFSSVSVSGGVGMQPFVARQIDYATGQPVAAIVAQAGTDPLAHFTNDCFAPSAHAHVSGASIGNGRPTGVTADYVGPSYLDFNNPATRKTCGYTADQLVRHYGFDEAHALGWNGKGQTIVIVDAYGSSTALADLNAFSTAMKLPTMGADSFKVVYPNGAPATSDAGWAMETTLDIEWAHAFAPAARIVLVVAPTADDPELAGAVQHAVEHHLGNVISNSYGLAEALSDSNSAKMFNRVFKRAAARGIAVNVASGDSADNGLGTPLGAPSVPADSPFATAVGGTSIGIPSADGPVEAAWGINATGLGSNLNPLRSPNFDDTVEGSGGGESVFLAKPRFQRNLPGTGRQVPDVSALADPQTGAIIVFTDPASGIQYYTTVGGTSLATPIFSAMWAVADQVAGESLGQAAPVMGRLPAFAVHDIVPIRAGKWLTSGSMTVGAGPTVQYTPAQLVDTQSTQPTGFASFIESVVSHQDGVTAYGVLSFGTDSSLMAAKGWDNVTGYGVPNGILFIDAARIFSRHPY